MEIVSRPQALAAGLKRYFTGIPCKCGHICERQVKSRGCMDCARRANQLWRTKLVNARKQRRWRRERTVKKYGLSLAEYDHRVKAQGGVCAICSMAPNSSKLVVDHNHLTGKLRMLLCHSCNVGLGHFRDSPTLLRKALAYLKGV